MSKVTRSGDEAKGSRCDFKERIEMRDHFCGELFPKWHFSLTERHYYERTKYIYRVLILIITSKLYYRGCRYRNLEYWSLSTPLSKAAGVATVLQVLDCGRLVAVLIAFILASLPIRGDDGGVPISGMFVCLPLDPVSNGRETLHMHELDESLVSVAVHTLLDVAVELGLLGGDSVGNWPVMKICVLAS